MPAITSVIFLSLLMASFVASMWLEHRHAARPATLSDRRMMVNFGLGVAGMTLAALVRAAPAVAVYIGPDVWRPPFGPQSWPLPLETVAAVLLFSLIAYGLHRAMHTIPVLWRLHRVHHSDASVDFSTGFRSHPLAFLLSSMVASATVVVVGFSELAVIVALSAMHSVDLFIHANGNLPDRIERWVGWVLVTPSIHLRHHSQQRSEHDSNFGTVLIIWDRLFGTYSGRQVPEALGLKPSPD